MQGCVFDIAEGTIHDGPGLRITVFLKGCPLRCKWCHSPEGQSPAPEVLHFPGMPDRQCGRIWESAALAERLQTLGKLLGHGRITFSGGEPLLQGDFLLEVLDRLPDYHIILDTCGFAEESVFSAVVSKVQCVYFGLKLLNDAEALRWTGQPSSPVLRNLRWLDQESEVPYHLRIPLLAGITGSDAYLQQLMQLTQTLHRAERIDFLPSNPEAGAKYPSCGRTFAPGFDVREQYHIPDWFQPFVPFRVLSADTVE